MRIFVYALYIAEEYELACLHSRCDRACSVVGIHVIRLTVLLTETDRADDRNEVILEQSVDQGRIDFCDFTDKTDIAAVREFSLFNTHRSAVLAGDTAGLDAVSFHVLNKTFVDLAKHHLSDLHSLCVCHTEAVHEFRGLAGEFDPFADFFSSAVNNDRLHTDKLEERHILDDTLLQVGIRHCGSTVFDYDRLSVKLADIGQRFDEYLRLFQP